MKEGCTPENFHGNGKNQGIVWVKLEKFLTWFFEGQYSREHSIYEICSSGYDFPPKVFGNVRCEKKEIEPPRTNVDFVFLPHSFLEVSQHKSFSELFLDHGDNFQDEKQSIP